MCHANIDLTTVVLKVNNGVVSTMIHKQGKLLSCGSKTEGGRNYRARLASGSAFLF
ncbi:hypothetical protein RchiOBHm_Chr7g0227041 [Rosa chinensis]|uniref:Uncharacterized protein n=1 Tax=Rosa chinensis TaxID=74649 RepID=A0A2P6PEI5_ROSCH|nr:hypothetical protein RchiOBHm_Chr7g0227041 [Rosa chinensis]